MVPTAPRIRLLLGNPHPHSRAQWQKLFTDVPEVEVCELDFHGLRGKRQKRPGKNHVGTVFGRVSVGSFVMYGRGSLKTTERQKAWMSSERLGGHKSPYDHQQGRKWQPQWDPSAT